MGLYGDSRAISALLDVLPENIRGRAWMFIRASNGKPFIRLNVGAGGEAFVMPKGGRWRLFVAFPGYEDTEADLGPSKGNAKSAVAELALKLLSVAEERDNSPEMGEVLALSSAFAQAAGRPGLFSVATERWADVLFMRGQPQNAIDLYESALGAARKITSQDFDLARTEQRLSMRIANVYGTPADETSDETDKPAGIVSKHETISGIDELDLLMLFFKDSSPRGYRESVLLRDLSGMTDSASITAVRADLESLLSHGYIAEVAAEGGVESRELPWDRVLRGTSAGADRMSGLVTAAIAEVLGETDPPAR